MDLNVLHVVQPTEGGAARCAADLAIDQARRGWSVTVACPPGEPMTGWLRAAGVPQIDWEARRSPLTTAQETRHLAQIVSAVGPSLLHLHSAKAGLAGRLCTRGSIPTVYQPHAWSFHAVSGVLGKATVMWERRAARWTDAILCVSRGEAAIGRSAGIAGALEVIPNGVDLDRWSFAGEARRAEARELLRLTDVPLVVCVGRITKQKGQDILLAAWPQVTEEVPEAGLVLVGDGPARREWEALAGPSVTFAGQTPDTRPWLAAADVVAIPSRWEGMSLAMLEAMATGRPVVSTDVDGAADALGDDAGATVPIGDTARLAAETTLRLKDPARREREGLQARRKVETSFDLRLVFDRVAALYKKVIRRRDLYR